MRGKRKIFFLFFLFLLSLFFGRYLFFEKLKIYLFSSLFFSCPEVFVPPFKLLKPLPEISAKSFLLLKTDLKNFEKIIAEKNKNLPLPIASLTKLMTALLILEENPDLEKTVQISRTAANQEPVPLIGNLKVGERLKLKQLLELSLIYSSNSAAFALAESFDGDFVQKMNQKAKEIGMENTFFVNSTGLEPENISFSENKERFNFSSASDLAKLAKYILKHKPLIFEISKTQPTYKLENGILDVFLPFYLIGGKTGYAKEAGGCILLVFSDPKTPDLFYIAILLGAENKRERIEEMQKLINWLCS